MFFFYLEIVLDVSKQLHISTASVAFSNAHFGAGAGPIYLANIGCSGSESNLTDCSHNFTVSCNNGHSEDAGVRCQGRFLQNYNSCNV